MTNKKIENLIEELRKYEMVINIPDELIKNAREAIEELYEDIKNLEDKLYEG